MPPPNRFSPAGAWSVVRANYVVRGGVHTPSTSELLQLLESAPGARIAGGRIYDAITAVVAESTLADALLTFNTRDFAPLLRTVALVTPRES